MPHDDPKSVQVGGGGASKSQCTKSFSVVIYWDGDLDVTGDVNFLFLIYTNILKWLLSPPSMFQVNKKLSTFPKGNAYIEMF